MFSQQRCRLVAFNPESSKLAFLYVFYFYQQASFSLSLDFATVGGKNNLVIRITSHLNIFLSDLCNTGKNLVLFPHFFLLAFSSQLVLSSPQILALVEFTGAVAWS